jgi:hypothetical protein
MRANPCLKCSSGETIEQILVFSAPSTFRFVFSINEIYKADFTIR